MEDGTGEEVLAGEDGDVGFGLVAVGETKTVGLDRRQLSLDEDVEQPVGVGGVSAREGNFGVEDNVFEQVKVLGVVFHVLLEVVGMQVSWVF